jgi:hypothetical protein
LATFYGPFLAWAAAKKTRVYLYVEKATYFTEVKLSVTSILKPF